MRFFSPVKFQVMRKYVLCLMFNCEFFVWLVGFVVVVVFGGLGGCFFIDLVVAVFRFQVMASVYHVKLFSCDFVFKLPYLFVNDRQ